VVIGDPGPDFLFDDAVYVRGAMTLHQLRLTVGDDDFFKILRKWVKLHAGGNVTTDEFIELAERVSGQDLSELFDAWLFTPGRPELPAPLSLQSSTMAQSLAQAGTSRGVTARLGPKH
jgi:aminopeptidase N